jgi:hypothetical protein
MGEDDEAYTAAFDDGYHCATRDVVVALREEAAEWRARGSGAYAGAFRTAANYIERRFTKEGA